MAISYALGVSTSGEAKNIYLAGLDGYNDSSPKKFEIDDSGFPIVRFVGAFMLGQVLMALYILFIRRNGVGAAGSFFNLVFLTNLCIFLVNSYSILIDKTGVKTPEKSREGIIAPLIFSALSASLCYGLADKIYLY